jgi:U6 snRNA-associated Sm-like protein LSm6
MSKKPEEFLKKIIGKPVIVKLNSGLEYRGVMASLDGYLNVAMEQSEEWQNGKKSKKFLVSLLQFVLTETLSSEETMVKIIFLKPVLYISPQKSIKV